MIGSIARMLTSEHPLAPEEERALFSSLRLSNGLWKTTVAGRLGDLDHAMIGACRPGASFTQLLDVGVSSGTTSVEWLNAMRAAGFRPKLTATDLFLKTSFLAPWRWYQVLVNGNGRPLQHVVCGIPLRAWRRYRDVVTQYWLVLSLANVFYAAASRTKAMRTAAKSAKTVFLIAPQAANDPDIVFHEDDVFAENPAHYVDRFHAIRAANLLTPTIFPDDLLRRGVLNLRARLAGPGSLLIIARTDASEATNGTVFELTAHGVLEPVARLGDGSEIESLVASLPVAGT